MNIIDSVCLNSSDAVRVLSPFNSCGHSATVSESTGTGGSVPCQSFPSISITQPTISSSSKSRLIAIRVNRPIWFIRR